ncbi:Periplasmic thiol disulfide interchange protein DsbA [Enhygromyxa salina]|uniref:Periplasmic thiol disulfide interchange protein DsbA n=1 Tax=Enhygromyxa salina TaxID=215803 RepID=A0A0C2DGY2_9BACT|nr:Periplasmic thiol disulfide interchange protein DsbA [Enhygromyxa salina]
MAPASTGPPSIEGGKSASCAAASTGRLGFNGAALNRGRKVHLPCNNWETCSVGFNGAALNRGRKERLAGIDPRGDEASTGPPSIEGGKASTYARPGTNAL